MVRNSEGQAPDHAVQIIENAMAALWNRIKANPDSYLMDRNEFALYNYFQLRYTSGPDAKLAQKATARFWNAHHGGNGR